MTKIVLKGHKGIGGVAEGEALVTRDPISHMSDVGGVWYDEVSHMATNKLSLPDLYGKDLAGKVLVFSTGKGGIFSTSLLMGLVRHGVGPKAMVNIKSHPVYTLAAVVADIPIVDGLDKDPCEVIETGDFVKVNAEKGIVEVTKKS